MLAVYLGALLLVSVLIGLGVSAFFHVVRDSELSGYLSIVFSILVGGGFGALYCQLLVEAGYF